MNNTDNRLMLTALSHILDDSNYQPGWWGNILTMNKKKDAQLFQIVNMLKSYGFNVDGIYNCFDSLWSEIVTQYHPSSIFADLGLTGELFRLYKKNVKSFIEKKYKLQSFGRTA